MPPAPFRTWPAAIGVCLAASASNAQPGSIVGWGSNGGGQANPQPGRFLAATGNDSTSVAIREDHTLFQWGLNIFPPPSGTFTSVAGSRGFFLGLRTDGTLAFWGSSETPIDELPSGTFRTISVGHLQALAIRTDGSLVQWPDPAPTLPAGNDFVDIAQGEHAYAFALRANGTIEAWGDPFYAMYGVYNVPPGTYRAVVAGFWFGAALRTDGTVAIWGTYGGDPAAMPGVFTRLVAEDYFVLGLRPDGRLAQSAANGTAPPPPGSFVAVGAGSTYELAVVGCFANCDGSTVQPALNVNDFGCFLNKFAAGDSYANCDNSSSPPVLNVNDFSCFLNRFASGCS